MCKIKFNEYKFFISFVVAVKCCTYVKYNYYYYFILIFLGKKSLVCDLYSVLVQLTLVNENEIQVEFKMAYYLFYTLFTFFFCQTHERVNVRDGGFLHFSTSVIKPTAACTIYRYPLPLHIRKKLMADQIDVNSVWTGMLLAQSLWSDLFSASSSIFPYHLLGCHHRPQMLLPHRKKQHYLHSLTPLTNSYLIKQSILYFHLFDSLFTTLLLRDVLKFI